MVQYRYTTYVVVLRENCGSLKPHRTSYMNSVSTSCLLLRKKITVDQTSNYMCGEWKEACKVLRRYQTASYPGRGGRGSIWKHFYPRVALQLKPKVGWTWAGWKISTNTSREGTLRKSIKVEKKKTLLMNWMGSTVWVKWSRRGWGHTLQLAEWARGSHAGPQRARLDLNATPSVSQTYDQES